MTAPPDCIAVKQRGGVAVVQHPKDAVEPSMPANALREVAVDHCLPLAKIPTLLSSLSALPADRSSASPNERLEHEQALLLGQGDAMSHLKAIANPSPFACPECHGALWQVRDSHPPQYRCHTGHAYTERSFENGLAIAGDEASWNALRAMQERLFFVEHMARVRRDAGDVFNAERLVAKGLLLQRRVEDLRGFLESTGIECEDLP